MGMAARKPEDGGEHESVRNKLEQILRDALRPKLGPRSMLLEELVEVCADAMRGKMILGIRRPKERKTTRRALAQRLPEVGVSFPYEHKGKRYQVSIVEGDMIEVECEGHVERYKTLKQVLTAILGYPKSIGGWQFFFGSLSSEEVSKRYKVEP